jgi:hypothetical protein
MFVLLPTLLLRGVSYFDIMLLSETSSGIIRGRVHRYHDTTILVAFSLGHRISRVAGGP